jgi:hypothetical protein
MELPYLGSVIFSRLMIMRFIRVGAACVCTIDGKIPSGSLSAVNLLTAEKIEIITYQ